MALWIALGVLVIGMLALDLFVFHRDAHEVKLREAAAKAAVAPAPRPASRKPAR